MGKIVYWIASIFCFILTIFYVIIAIGFSKLPTNTYGVSFPMIYLTLGLIIAPILLLAGGALYLFFALGKRKSNVLTLISTILLFLVFIIWLLLLILMIGRSGSILGFHGGIGVLGAALIIYGFPLYFGYPLVQFILTLIGFLTSRKSQNISAN